MRVLFITGAALLLLAGGFALAVHDYTRGAGKAAVTTLRPVVQPAPEPPSASTHAAETAPASAPAAAAEPAAAAQPGQVAAVVPPAPASGGPSLATAPESQPPRSQPRDQSKPKHDGDGDGGED